MIDASKIKEIFRAVSDAIASNKDLLTKLDSETGDGDLGISMDKGFRAIAARMDGLDETDMGRLLMKSSGILNETASSTLGTVISIGMMAGGKALLGVSAAGTREAAVFLETGIKAIMERAKSKPGDKTILDALYPAYEAVRKAEENSLGVEEAFEQAALAAKKGMEATVSMQAVHGRAAYYAEKSIGKQDGGATVAKIIFEAISDTMKKA